MTDEQARPTDGPSAQLDRHERELEAALRDLFGVGRMWASHGLTIGKMALDNGARTLALTANTLDKLAARLVDEQPDSTR